MVAELSTLPGTPVFLVRLSAEVKALVPERNYCVLPPLHVKWVEMMGMTELFQSDVMSDVQWQEEATAI